MQNIKTLADLIAEVESSNNQYAVRFEPAYHPDPAHVRTMAQECGVSFMTAETLCAMSFGLFQIMGDELVSLGLRISPIQLCCMPQTQENYFNAYCERAKINFSLQDVISDETKRMQFARAYNGPGNPEAYATRMLNVYQGGANG